MTEAYTVRRILVLQKQEVLVQQQEKISGYLQDALPGIALVFASSPEAIPNGLEVDTLIAPTLPWLSDALGRLSGLRWIHFLSAGVEKIWDMPFTKEGLWLTKSSGVHGAPMSEYALGAMLYFAKSFNRFVDKSRSNRWERDWLDELTGKKVLILGMGHVGSMVARRAKTFDMYVIGVQRRPKLDQWADAVIAFDKVAAELPESDYVVSCLPLTDATIGLVNERFVSSMKRGSVLIDISRGGVVKESAVIAGLGNGVLKGAALDVFETQPLPTNSPLWNDSRVLVTPHVSGTSPHYMDRALSVFVDNARRLMTGEMPSTPVDIVAGY